MNINTTSICHVNNLYPDDFMFEVTQMKRLLQNFLQSHSKGDAQKLLDFIHANPEKAKEAMAQMGFQPSNTDTNPSADLNGLVVALGGYIDGKCQFPQVAEWAGTVAYWLGFTEMTDGTLVQKTPEQIEELMKENIDGFLKNPNAHDASLLAWMLNMPAVVRSLSALTDDPNFSKVLDQSQTAVNAYATNPNPTTEAAMESALKQLLSDMN